MKNNTKILDNNDTYEHNNCTQLTEESKHFIDDDLVNNLLAIREEIYKKTEINVSPRKLVNMIIRKSDINEIRDQLIKKYE